MTTYLEDLEAKQRETAERVEAARVDVAWLSTLYARHGAPQDARRLAKGATDANLVTVKDGTGGKVHLYNAAGTTHLLADLAGLVHQRAMFDPAAPVLAVTGLARERRMAAGELETAWFERHRSSSITDLPAHWPANYCAVVERRIALIGSLGHA